MTKKLEPSLPKIYDLDLYYQIWQYDVSKLHDVSKYSISILYGSYALNLSPKDFYIKHCYLPF